MESLSAAANGGAALSSEGLDLQTCEEESDLVAGLDKAMEDCAVVQGMVGSDLVVKGGGGVVPGDVLPQGGSVAPAFSDVRPSPQDGSGSEGDTSPLQIAGVQDSSLICHVGSTAEDDYVMMSSAEGEGSGVVVCAEVVGPTCGRRWGEGGEGSVSDGSSVGSGDQEKDCEGGASSGPSLSNGLMGGQSPDHSSCSHTHNCGSWGHTHNRGSWGHDSEQNLDSPSSLSKELCPLYEDSTDGSHMYFTDPSDSYLICPATCRLSVYSLKSAFTYLDAQGEMWC